MQKTSLNEFSHPFPLSLSLYLSLSLVRFVTYQHREHALEVTGCRGCIHVLLLDKVARIVLIDGHTVLVPSDLAAWHTLDAAGEIELGDRVQHARIGLHVLDEKWRSMYLQIDCGHYTTAALIVSIARVVRSAVKTHRLDGPLSGDNVLQGTTTSTHPTVSVGLRERLSRIHEFAHFAIECKAWGCRSRGGCGCSG